MSAKEMFEQIHFYLDIKNNKEILYKMKWEISSTYWIAFNLSLQSVKCFETSDSPFEPSKPFEVSKEELRAINKQVEELGWK